jgi:hypothetical protein
MLDASVARVLVDCCEECWRLFLVQSFFFPGSEHPSPQTASQKRQNRCFCKKAAPLERRAIDVDKAVLRLWCLV